MSKVYLVGAGPGDPNLLTIKAARLLQAASVVLHDALVSREILALINPRAAVIDVGKRCGPKLLTQKDINALLIAYSAKSEIVIRLKGGDPSIFAHGSEEIEALDEARVEFEIVPGITSALAAAAAAKITLTDRQCSDTVIFTTAHRAAGAEPFAKKLVVPPRTTLVIYMPGSDYSNLAEQLREAGISLNTPCVVISKIGYADQRVIHSEIGKLTRLERLPLPALFIIGDCTCRNKTAVKRVFSMKWMGAEAATSRT